MKFVELEKLLGNKFAEAMEAQGKAMHLCLVENLEEANEAKANGWPYVRWTKGVEEFKRIILRPAMQKLYPYIDWNEVYGTPAFATEIEVIEGWDEGDFTGRVDLGAGGSSEELSTDYVDVSDLTELSYEEDSEYSQSTDGTRLFNDLDKHAVPVWKKLDLATYVGDLSSYVDIEILQSLKLMPQFIGDMLDCIKTNLTSATKWSEGYNKKRGCCVGNFNRSAQLPNLIILDVSGSIPRGISATMISLIDTLRHQVNADLIITSSISRYYPIGSELPDPEEIRELFGFGNESHDFFTILTNHISGRKWGHVFSFGDNDTPYYDYFSDYPDRYTLQGASVEMVHHYHTRYDNTRTGYAKWCHLLGTQPAVEYNTDWCSVIR